MQKLEEWALLGGNAVNVNVGVTNVGKSKFVVFPARICVAVVSFLHSKEIELKLHD